MDEKTNPSKDGSKNHFHEEKKVTKSLSKTAIFCLETETYTKRRKVAEIKVIIYLLHPKTRFCQIDMNKSWLEMVGRTGLEPATFGS
jgi:hypothetical protein